MMIASILGAGQKGPVENLPQNGECDPTAETEFVAILTELSAAPAPATPVEDRWRVGSGSSGPTDTDSRAVDSDPLAEVENVAIPFRDQLPLPQPPAWGGQESVVGGTTEGVTQSIDWDPPPQTKNVSISARMPSSPPALATQEDADRPTGGWVEVDSATLPAPSPSNTTRALSPDQAAKTVAETPVEGAPRRPAVLPSPAQLPSVDPSTSLPFPMTGGAVRREGAPFRVPVTPLSYLETGLSQVRENGLQTGNRTFAQAALEDRRTVSQANALANGLPKNEGFESGSIQAENRTATARPDHPNVPRTGPQLGHDPRAVPQPLVPVLTDTLRDPPHPTSAVRAVPVSAPLIPPTLIQAGVAPQADARAIPLGDTPREPSARSAEFPASQSAGDKGVGHTVPQLEQTPRPDVTFAAITGEDTPSIDPLSPSPAPVPPSLGGQTVAPGGGPPHGSATLPSVPLQLSSELAAPAAAGPEGPVTLQLRPEELGLLHFQLTRTAEGTHIHLTVEQPATLDLLRRHADDLLADLQRAGFAGTSLSYSGSDGRAPAQSQSAPASDEPTDTSSQPAFSTAPLRMSARGSLDLRL